jgi:hypothetical protein
MTQKPVLEVFHVHDGEKTAYQILSMNRTTSERISLAVLLRLNGPMEEVLRKTASVAASAALTLRRLFITCPISEPVKHGFNTSSNIWGSMRAKYQINIMCTRGRGDS